MVLYFYSIFVFMSYINGSTIARRICPCGHNLFCTKSGRIFIANKINMVNVPFKNPLQSCDNSERHHNDCIVSNRSLLLSIGFILKGYPAEMYSIWNNESFLSVMWKPETHDSLIPHRYPPLMENTTVMKVLSNQSNLEESALFITLRFSDINMKYRSKYAIKIRAVYFNECNQLVTIDSSMATIDIVFACEEIIGTSCNDSIQTRISPICGLAENISIIFTDNDYYRISYKVSMLNAQTIKNREITYVAIYGHCLTNESILWNGYCIMDITKSEVIPICGHLNRIKCQKEIRSSLMRKESNTTALFGFDICASHGLLEWTTANRSIEDVRLVRMIDLAKRAKHHEYIRQETSNVLNAINLFTYIIIVSLLCSFIIWRILKNYRKKREDINRFIAQFGKCDDWEVDLNDITIHYDQQIGSGAFGIVFLGSLNRALYSDRNISNNIGTSQYVAVKMLKKNADIFAKNNFLAEINIHQQIPRHPYLVNLIGVITLSQPLCIITEYCEKGSLLLYLRERCEYMLKLEEWGIDLEKDDIEALEYSIRLDMIVTYEQMLRFAIEICAGMKYLSGCGYIHRDLATRNIFVTAEDRLKIGDFGLCRAMDSDENYYKGHGGNLPLKWMSPEAIRHFDFSLKSDVWSFGVVLFELVTLGGTPYPNVLPCDLLKYLNDGQRLAKPRNCGDKLYAIMLHCWQDKPTERPTFIEIQEKLNDLYELPGKDNTSQYYLKLDRTAEYYNLIEEGNIENPDVNQEQSTSGITSKISINNKNNDPIVNRVTNNDLCQGDILSEENQCFISGRIFK